MPELHCWKVKELGFRLRTHFFKTDSKHADSLFEVICILPRGGFSSKASSPYHHHTLRSLCRLCVHLGICISLERAGKAAALLCSLTRPVSPVRGLFCLSSFQAVFGMQVSSAEKSNTKLNYCLLPTHPLLPLLPSHHHSLPKGGWQMR